MQRSWTHADSQERTMSDIYLWLITILIVTLMSGCTSATPKITPSSSPTAISIPDKYSVFGTGESLDLFTPNNLQNLDSEAKQVVTDNLKIIYDEW